MKLLSKSIALLAVAHATLAPLAATAADDAAAAQGSAALAAFRQRFASNTPGTRIDSVAATPVPGVYEVVMGRNVAYVESSGRYALLGHLYDLRESRDITADRLSELDRVDTRLLPTERALRHVSGSGSRTLYVFADPQCGYCKQLEKTLEGLDDVTVYTFMLPILGPESRRLAEAVACSPDPALAWSEWMREGRQPGAAGGCAQGSASIDAVSRHAGELGINGTPTLVAADGRKATGARDLVALRSWLAPSTVAARANKGTTE